MDEAGYGPNLGPLVVTATVWEVPGDAAAFDWWGALEGVVANAPGRGDARLHVADSKAVYSPSRGIGPLERSVLALLSTLGTRPSGLREAWESLAGHEPCTMDDEPWFTGEDVSLPVAANDEFDTLADGLRTVFEELGVRLRAVRSDVVAPRRFNELTRAGGNKAVALSSISARLLRTVWDPHGDEPTFVVADKHGGRDRYDGVLSEVTDDRMILRLDEGRERSRYRVGNTEIRFQTKAEAWLPVAVASMVSKYLREVAMERFNAYWRTHVPDLKPTKGYPVDAKRFRRDVEEARQRLGIPDDVFWRER